MSHKTHCDQGEYLGSCKYGDEDCPMTNRLAEVTQDEIDAAMICYQETTDCGCSEEGIKAALLDFAHHRIAAVEADNARLRAVMERCAVIVDRNLYRQHEKIEDVPKFLLSAIRENKHD